MSSEVPGQQADQPAPARQGEAGRAAAEQAGHAPAAAPLSINGFDVPDQRIMYETLGRGPGELAERMGMLFIKLTPEHSIALLPVEGNRQPLGLLHGGAYCVLGESLGSFAANLHAARSGGYAVGIDINATHTSSATSGYVTGECRAIKLGSSLTVHEIVVSDEAGTRCSTVRITNLVRSRRAS